MLAKAKTTKSNAKINNALVPPPKYQVVVWKPGRYDRQMVNGRSNADFAQLGHMKREAIALCRRHTLALGLGASGQVQDGFRYTHLVYHCRVVPSNTGRPVLVDEPLRDVRP